MNTSPDILLKLSSCYVGFTETLERLGIFCRAILPAKNKFKFLQTRTSPLVPLAFYISFCLPIPLVDLQSLRVGRMVARDRWGQLGWGAPSVPLLLPVLAFHVGDGPLAGSLLALCTSFDGSILYLSKFWSHLPSIVDIVCHP